MMSRSEIWGGRGPNLKEIGRPMTYWPHEVWKLTPLMIMTAVDNPDWQKFRLSLKGLPTSTKLQYLDGYLREHFCSALSMIRVSNYINALKRGGQLNMKLEVVR